MKALWPRDLDLAALRAHVQEYHPGEADSLPETRADVSRLHAQWHAFPGLHTHTGDLTSVEFARDIFSVHPLGRFTGRNVRLLAIWPCKACSTRVAPSTS